MTEQASGYIIRRATPDDLRAIATVLVQSWQSSYREILPQDLLAGLSIERRIEGWRGELSEPRHATFVRTTPEGAVVGVCNAGSNRRDSPLSHREVYAIYVLDGAKRKGLGCALFIEATAWLKQNDKLGAWPRCTGPKTPAIL